MTTGPKWSISGRTVHILLFCASFLILLGGYAFNLYGTAPGDWFSSYRDSEALIVGRMTPKSDAGFFANGGFPGELLSDQNSVPATYDHYVNDRPPPPSDAFFVYTGQFGLHGHVLTLADRVLRFVGLGGASRLWLLHFAVAAALAATLAWILAGLRREFGLVPALCALALLVFSPWLTAFGRDLYWVPFTWFLPMAAAWHLYVFRPPPAGRHLVLALAWIGGLVLVKALCGFEYITAIAGGTVAIVGYGLIRSRARLPAILFHGALVSFAIVVATVGAIAIQVIATGLLFGSLRAGLGNFVERVLYRTYGDPAANAAVLADSLNATVFDVVWVYWFSGCPILAIGSVLVANAAQIVARLLALIAGFSLVGLWRHRGRPDRCSQCLAILFLAAATMIASMSWFVVAKAHSYIHTHMNYVLWHVPFLLFGGALALKAVRMAVPKGIAELIVVGVVAIGIYSGPSQPWDGTPYATFDTQRGQVSVFREGMLFDLPCEEIEERQRFFVHVGSEARFLPDASRDSGFVNLDFSWRANRASTLAGEWLTGRCSAFAASPAAPLNQMPIGSLDFGQFRHKKDWSQIWGVRLDAERLGAVAGGTLAVADLTDSNWDHGVQRSGNGFVALNSFENRQRLAANRGVVIDGVKIPFEEIVFGDAWITFVYGDNHIPLNVDRSLELYSD